MREAIIGLILPGLLLAGCDSTPVPEEFHRRIEGRIGRVDYSDEVVHKMDSGDYAMCGAVRGAATMGLWRRVIAGGDLVMVEGFDASDSTDAFVFDTSWKAVCVDGRLRPVEASASS